MCEREREREREKKTERRERREGRGRREREERDREREREREREERKGLRETQKALGFVGKSKRDWERKKLIKIYPDYGVRVPILDKLYNEHSAGFFFLKNRAKLGYDPIFIYLCYLDRWKNNNYKERESNRE